MESLKQDGTDVGDDAQTDWNRSLRDPNALDRRMLQDCSASWTRCNKNSRCPTDSHAAPTAVSTTVQRLLATGISVRPGILTKAA